MCLRHLAHLAGALCRRPCATVPLLACPAVRRAKGRDWTPQPLRQHRPRRADRSTIGSPRSKPVQGFPSEPCLFIEHPAGTAGQASSGTHSDKRTPQTVPLCEQTGGSLRPPSHAVGQASIGIAGWRSLIATWATLRHARATRATR